MTAEVTPARIGLLIDHLDDKGGYDENVLPSLQLVADDYVARGILERPVEFVVRAVQESPRGSFRPVRDAFYELVDEDALVIFGPWVSENGVALRRYVQALAQVPIITMAASETMLGEWVFGLPAGSMEEEPIIMATVAALDGCRSVGLAFEDSLIGREYLRTTREACRDAGADDHCRGRDIAGRVGQTRGDGGAGSRQTGRHHARGIRAGRRRHERGAGGHGLDATSIHHYRFRIRSHRTVVA